MWFESRPLSQSFRINGLETSLLQLPPIFPPNHCFRPKRVLKRRWLTTRTHSEQACEIAVAWPKRPGHKFSSRRVANCAPSHNREEDSAFLMAKRRRRRCSRRGPAPSVALRRARSMHHSTLPWSPRPKPPRSQWSEKWRERRARWVDSEREK